MYFLKSYYGQYVLLQKQVRTQQIHEMKKKEKEYIKLQVWFTFYNLHRFWFFDCFYDMDHMVNLDHAVDVLLRGCFF